MIDDKAQRVRNPFRSRLAELTDEQYDALADLHRELHPDKPKPGIPVDADAMLAARARGAGK